MAAVNQTKVENNSVFYTVQSNCESRPYGDRLAGLVVIAGMLSNQQPTTSVWSLSFRRFSCNRPKPKCPLVTNHATVVASLCTLNRLVGLVVKASSSRAEDAGFESRLRRDFFGVESYQRLRNWHSSGYPARSLVL